MLKDISIVIPVFNECHALEKLLIALRRFNFGQVIVVDGGSTDDPASHIQDEVLIRSDRGRGQQLAEGIQAARCNWIWLLHADTEFSDDAIDVLNTALGARGWGRFDVQIQGNHFLLPVISFLMNERSALTSICTGDQGIFVHRDILEDIGGMPRLPLMEDIELSKRLRTTGKPIRLRVPLHPSGRKWLREGIYRTTLRMWFIRFAYLLGVHPSNLVRWYYGGE